MPPNERRLGPSVARAAAGPASAFGALVSAAAKDPTAARGLAAAYATLDDEQRHAIVDAVVHDAGIEGVCASHVLACLLSVEDDPVVARHIADSMASLETHELSVHAQPRALVAGDERVGALMIIRPLHGTFVEVLSLAWEGDCGITHSHFEPLVHHGDVARQRQHLPLDLVFEQMPLSYAIDLVTVPLWQHRRLHGRLPDDMERFADLFSVDHPTAVEEGD